AAPRGVPAAGAAHRRPVYGTHRERNTAGGPGGGHRRAAPLGPLRSEIEHLVPGRSRAHWRDAHQGWQSRVRRDDTRAAERAGGALLSARGGKTLTHPLSAHEQETHRGAAAA